MTYLDDMRAAGARKLDAQAARARQYQAYYDGTEDIHAILNTQERRAFAQLLKEAGANWAELIVRAVAERLAVAGFRFPTSGGADAAWLLWQGNRLDAGSKLIQNDALITAASCMLVQLDERSPVGVRISGESPLEACVLYEPGDRYARAAGYKRYQDGPDVTDIVILPDEIATWYRGAGQPVVEGNPAGVVNLVEVTPQPQTMGPPRSELHSAVDIIDRIQTEIFARLVATDYGAFRQMAVSGVKMAKQVLQTAEGGEVVKYDPPFDIGANRLLVAENPNARFTAFPGDPLAGYLAGCEQDVNHLAAITQTPTYYLSPLINLSADAIRAADAGLVAKVGDRATFIGEAYEDAMRIALGLIGHPAALDVGAEVIWRDTENRSEAQRVDALVKMGSLGVPRVVLWERWGATPQEIARWQQLAAEQDARDAAAQAAALGAADIGALLNGGAPALPGPGAAG